MNLYTSPLAPSAPPSDLQSISVTPNSITYQWKEVQCCAQNGPILGYQIQVFQSGVIQHQSTLLGSQSTTYTITNFRYCQRSYSFSVAAVNEAGVGVQTKPLVAGIPHSGMYINSAILHVWRKVYIVTDFYFSRSFCSIETAIDLQKFRPDDLLCIENTNLHDKE